MSAEDASDWRANAFFVLAAFVITIVGGSMACVFWLRDLHVPSVTFIGSGSELSVLVADGPARLLLATGNDQIAFENAFLSTQPLFARRVDLLLISGQGASLRVPIAARHASTPRQILGLGPLPASPELEELVPIETMSGHRHIRLGTDTSVWIETRLPFGADDLQHAEAWRLTVEHRGVRIVVYSDGEAVRLFPPALPNSITAISGDDPLALAPGEGTVLVTNAMQIDGPELREALSASGGHPAWAIRVHPGDAVRMVFTEDGVDVPAWATIPVHGDVQATASR